MRFRNTIFAGEGHQKTPELVLQDGRTFGRGCTAADDARRSEQ